MTGTLLDIEAMRHELLGTYINVALAIQIKQLRLAKGWSQEQLAQKAGLHQPQIVLIESVRWEHWPRIETLQKIGRALDVALRVRFEEWGSLVAEFLHNSDIPTPPDFEHDPLFAPPQSANLEKPQPANEPAEERQKQNEETENPT